MRFTTPLFLSLILCTFVPAHADNVNQASPPLFFREDFREIPAETPLTQEHIHVAGLMLERHGPGRDLIKKSHHDSPPDDPYYIWSGQCKGTWMVSLAKRDESVDLSRGIIRWRTKNYGRVLRVALETADGTWIVSDHGTGETPDWHEFTIHLETMTWHMLDSTHVIAGEEITSPDLANVRKIGFTDLDQGGQSAACSRLDWIEVYGR